MDVYGLKNCDTCRKAVNELNAAGIDAKLQDVREKPVPSDVLAAALAEFGDRLVNTRSTTWRGMDEATRALGPSQIIEQSPSVMKRPLATDGQKMSLGWDAAAKSVWI